MAPDQPVRLATDVSPYDPKKDVCGCVDRQHVCSSGVVGAAPSLAAPYIS